MEFENNAYFWQKLDTLYLSGTLTIDHPRGSTNEDYTNLVYPVDYGYLSGSQNDKEHHIRAYKGSAPVASVGAVVVCADILNRDVEVKLLIGVTPQEEEAILVFLDQTDFQKAVLLRRGETVPEWAAVN